MPDEAQPDEAQPDAGQPLREPPQAEPGRRRLRGTGSGFGHTDDPGGMAADFARRLREAAEQRRPALERTAREAMELARDAADAARLRVEQAARDAAAFAGEHKAELRAAATRTAQVAGRMAVPPALRPLVDAAEREFYRDERPAAPAAEPAPPLGGDEPPARPPAGENRTA